MKNINWKALAPHGIVLLIFLAITIVFTLPEFQGNKISTHDEKQWLGASKEMNDYREETGDEALWTGRMFSGMPTYQISFKPEHIFLQQTLYKIVTLNLPRTASYVWLGMLGFYLCALTLGMRFEVAAAGAIAFSLSSNFYVLMGAGHFAKVVSVLFMPFVLTGIVLVFKKKYAPGFIVVTLAMLLEVFVNHIQMTYYFFAFFISFYFLYQLVKNIRTKTYKHFIIAFVLCMIGITTGTVSNLNRLLPTQEYSRYTIRGGSELKELVDKNDATGGLDRSYILGYSFGKSEFWSFMIPNFKGGGNGLMSQNEVAMNAVSAAEKNALKSADQYWGAQRSAGGAVYMGACIFIMFVLLLFLIPVDLKWVLLPSFILTLMLSWGSNYPEFSNLFIDYFPLYNKFRAPNSMLVVPQFLVALGFALGLNYWIANPGFLKQPASFFGKTLKYSNGKITLVTLLSVIGILGIIWLAPGIVQDFMKPNETENYLKQGLDQATVDSFMAIVVKARKAIFKADVIRTALILILFTVAFYLYFRDKIKGSVIVYCIAGITLIDLWLVDRRYLTSANYIPTNKVTQLFPTKADNAILSDKAKDYRVLNLATNGGPFNDGETSYFHRSVGGYHGAKLGRYQEAISYIMQQELGIFSGVFKSKPVTMSKIDSAMQKMHIFNMLNTKYIILDTEDRPIENYHTRGAGWFVNEIKLVKSADEEIRLTATDATANAAVIHEKFSADISVPATLKDTGSVIMTEYSPNHVSYSVNAPQDGFAVFSEIYYPKGWKAFIDGKEVPIIQTNYIFRGLSVPAGTHQVKFSFEPEVVYASARYSLIGIITIIVTVLAAAGWWLIQSKKKAKNG